MTFTPTPDDQNGEFLWFLNSLVRIGVSSREGTDGLCVMEHCVRHGDSPPLHRHETEDEFFHILKGEFRFVLDGQSQRIGPGAMVLAPKGSQHTYRAESPDGGCFVTVTRGEDFERFVRALSRPAERRELPPPSGPPSPEAMQAIEATASERGITFHGPPLGPEASDAEAKSSH
jgi:quercetin dioxygenase-like cupin family protein